MKKKLQYYHSGIPSTDILDRPLNIGDTVTIFNEHFVSWENCTIVEKEYAEDDIRRAIQVDDNMWFFGLGTHEILKDVR